MPAPEAYHWKRRVCELLERQTLTQARLAEIVGTTPNTVARWKRGEHVPRRSYQEKILGLLEKSIKSKGFNFYLRERTRILALEASGRKAIAIDQKTIIVTAPTMSEFAWDFFCDGRIGEVHVSPGHISRVFEHLGKIYQIQDLKTELKAGQVFKILCTVEILDSFLSDHEWTAFEINIPTEYCRMIVRFPKDRPYRSYSIVAMLGDRHLKTQGPVIEKETEERYELGWEIDKPKFNAIYTLAWDW